MKKNVIKKTLIILSIIIVAGTFIIFSPYLYFFDFVKYDKSAYENLSSYVIIANKNEEKKINLNKKIKNYVFLEKIPEYTRKMFISTEDRKFYSHNGIDIIRIFGAGINNFTKAKFSQGGSTITQQLVKNTQLSNEKSIKRKINEIKIAQRLEKDYSKNEILQMYLNSLYFGNGIYGISDASEYYFSKKVDNLSISESATLVSIINNPTVYNPITNLKNCKKRRDLILSIAKQENIISEKEYKRAINEDIVINLNNIKFDHFDSSVISQLENERIKINKGMKIFVEKDIDLQNYCDKLLFESNFGNTTIIVANNNTESVIAKSSTFNFDIFNSKFQPGSTIKPFVSYAPLIDNDEIYTCSIANDQPISVEGYSPQNYNNVYRGNITQSEALAISSNSVALSNCQKHGLEKCVKFASKFGYVFDKDDFKNYATCLGAVKNGVTLEEILKSYMIIANNGKNINLTYFNKIYQNSDNVCYKSVTDEQVIKESTAYLLSDMLYNCAKTGTAKTLRSLGNVRAKTGTVGDRTGNDYCYCVGFTPNYTVIVCISKDEKKLPLSITGASTPTRILRKIFEKLDDKEEFAIPNSVVIKEIDLQKWKEGKVVLASEKTKIKDKKNCYFSRNNIPSKYSSFNDYLDNLFYNDNFRFFDSLVN